MTNSTSSLRFGSWLWMNLRRPSFLPTVFSWHNIYLYIIFRRTCCSVILVIVVSIWIVARLRLHKFHEVSTRVKPMSSLHNFSKCPWYLSGSFICQICKAESEKLGPNSSVHTSAVPHSGFSMLDPKSAGTNSLIRGFYDAPLTSLWVLFDPHSLKGRCTQNMMIAQRNGEDVNEAFAMVNMLIS